MYVGIWAFYVPSPPKGYLSPQAGDVLTPRQCDFCGHSLAEYRGIVEADKFFCNGEHQASFHLGKTYTPYQERL